MDEYIDHDKRECPLLRLIGDARVIGHECDDIPVSDRIVDAFVMGLFVGTTAGIMPQSDGFMAHLMFHMNIDDHMLAEMCVSNVYALAAIEAQWLRSQERRN